MKRERRWQLDGACVGRADHADLWFPQAGQSAEAARAVCARCAVRDECLEYAIENKITEGMWGGLTPSERRQVRLTRQQANAANHSSPAA